MPQHPTGPGLDGPVVTIERAAELLLCKRTRVFELLAEGRLKRAPKLGKKATVRLDSVLSCLDVDKERETAPHRKRQTPTRRTQSIEAAFREVIRSVEGSS